MPHQKKKHIPSPASAKITTFFAPTTLRPSTTVPSGSPDTSYPSTAPPQLPSTVQSSLLNVGMRVRKSVPEGYKTCSKSTLFPCASQPDTLTRSLDVDGAGWSGRSQPDMQARRSAGPVPQLGRAHSRENELQPFCGLHATGGVECHAPDVPGLSFASTLSSGRSEVGGIGRGKRAFDDQDEDEEGEGDFGRDVEAEMDAFFGGGGGREIAVPRGRMGAGKRGGGVAQVLIGDAGLRGVGLAGRADFEEADVGWLRPMDCAD